VENPSALHASPPKTVHAVPQLLADLERLQTLFQVTHPPERVVWTSSVAFVFYSFGDASGSGFGSTITTSAGIHFRNGVWGDDLAGLPSNYQESFNLSEAAPEHINQLRFDQLQAMVTSVASEATAGHLSSCEFYLFTDNAVAEAAFYKGTSSNPLLFDLVLRLKQLELTHSFSLQVIHVSGKRMQVQGTDGLSRGDLFTGVMRGQPLTHFIPLHQSAVTRSDGIVPWCESWIPASYLVHDLTPVEWFSVGHGVQSWELNTDHILSPIQFPASQRSSCGYPLQWQLSLPWNDSHLLV
jgi:hypothetical protein